MYKLWIAAALAALALLELWKNGPRAWRRPRQDWLVELTSTALVPGAIIPLVTYASASALAHLAPQRAGALAGLPWPLMVVAFLLVDDLTQYGWHRLSHTHPLLWRLHRAHHAAPTMGVSVTFRNNLFYYAMMPGLWLAPILVYLGMGSVYPYYAIAKMVIIAGAHSEVRYDRVLWRSRFTRPLAWLLERVISTPATHFAHHGLHADDPGTHYRGNYGNALFVWDLLFGTGKITRIYPEAYGIEGEPAQTWATQLFWPLAPERREDAAPVEAVESAAPSDLAARV
ncbi:MAG TPA: sterol desaturase family protein [Polyangiaceae bacterium]|nr:sterol desaturase family protein [Polyangiaceae bacterium]